MRNLLNDAFPGASGPNPATPRADEAFQSALNSLVQQVERKLDSTQGDYPAQQGILRQIRDRFLQAAHLYRTENPKADEKAMAARSYAMAAFCTPPAGGDLREFADLMLQAGNIFDELEMKVELALVKAGFASIHAQMTSPSPQSIQTIGLNLDSATYLLKQAMAEGRNIDNHVVKIAEAFRHYAVLTTQVGHPDRERTLDSFSQAKALMRQAIKQANEREVLRDITSMNKDQLNVMLAEIILQEAMALQHYNKHEDINREELAEAQTLLEQANVERLSPLAIRKRTNLIPRIKKLLSSHENN